MKPVKMYTAAVFTNQMMPGQTTHERRLEPHEKEICKNAPYILESYHYVKKDKFVREIRNAGGKVFLDSGAFSAHTLGVQIDIPEYCNYIQRNIDIIRVEEGVLMASVMDAIGDAQKTYENQLYMESLGVKPMPAFHGGEDTRYLDWYVANYEYVNLGGLVGVSPAQLEIWLDRVWNNHLLDGTGNPKVKIHGFGITAEELMCRYPWHSVDSSSWVQAAAFGSVMVPGMGALSVSTKSPSRHDHGGHVTTLTAPERAAVEARIAEYGFNLERLSENPFSRFAFNINAYRSIENLVNEEKVAKGAPSLRRELF